MNRKIQINGWYLVAAVFGVLAIQQWWIESQQVETLPYSRFEQMLDAGKIQSVRITDKYITGTLKEAPPGDRTHFITVQWARRSPKESRIGASQLKVVSRTTLFGTFSPGFCLSCSSSASGPFSYAGSPRSRAWEA